MHVRALQNSWRHPLSLRCEEMRHLIGWPVGDIRRRHAVVTPHRIRARSLDLRLLDSIAGMRPSLAILDQMRRIEPLSSNAIERNNFGHYLGSLIHSRRMYTRWDEAVADVLLFDGAYGLCFPPTYLSVSRPSKACGGHASEGEAFRGTACHRQR